MSNQFEPQNTGNPDLDKLLSSAKQDPLIMNVNEVESLLKTSATAHKPSGLKGNFFRMLIGFSIATIVTISLLKYRTEPITSETKKSESTTIANANPAPTNSNSVSQSDAQIQTKNNELPSTEINNKTKSSSSDSKSIPEKTIKSTKIGGSATVYLEYNGSPATVIVSSTGVQQITVANKNISRQDFPHYESLVQQAYEKSGIQPDKNIDMKEVSPALALTDELRAMKLIEGDESFEFVLYGDSAVFNSITLPPADFIRLKKAYETNFGKTLHPNAKIRLKH